MRVREFYFSDPAIILLIAPIAAFGETYE